MAYQSIGLGSAADDGTGDSLRAGGTKVNANFSEIYTLLGTGTALVSSITADADDVTFVGDSYNAVWDKSASALAFADNAKILLGTGSDFEIYHDGSNSVLKDAGTGSLILMGSTVALSGGADGAETMANFADNGPVTLYYDNSAKFATTTSGISVTGTIVSSGNIELGASATLIFEGATADAHETVLTVVDPTADRTITLPNSTGTLITTGDTSVITTTMIADDAITTAKIATGNVTGDSIGANAVGISELATNAVTTIKITDNAVTGAKIAGGSIVSAHIAADTVAESNMADDSVGSDQLKTLSTLLIKNSSGSTLKTCHCAGA